MYFATELHIEKRSYTVKELCNLLNEESEAMNYRLELVGRWSDEFSVEIDHETKAVRLCSEDLPSPELIGR